MSVFIVLQVGKDKSSNHDCAGPMKQSRPSDRSGEDHDGGDVPTAARESYTMVDPRFREIYFQFYKETYRPSALDRRTKELVAIAAALAFKCQGCLEGHLKKAIKMGATRDEISETIAITMGVGAASVVDLTDIAASNLKTRLF